MEAFIKPKVKKSTRKNKPYKNGLVATPGYHEVYDSPFRELLIKKVVSVNTAGA